MRSRNQKWNRVLITGASSGLGEEYARQLAPYAHELILVARRLDRLETIASELKQINSALIIVCQEVDLCSSTQRERFLQKLNTEHESLDLLVNNAGMGDYGSFEDSTWEKVEDMMALNMIAVTHLTYACLPLLKASSSTKSSTGIIHVSSLASVAPLPDFAVYAATKAYVTSFSEALRIELRESGISVLALCPGPVPTEFKHTAFRDNEKQGFPGREALKMEKSEVIRSSLIALEKKQARCFPGYLVSGLARLVDWVPFSWIRLLLNRRPRRMGRTSETN